MNKDEKVKFVNDLVGSMTATIIEAIEDGRIPEDWDGHELRAYIRDLATRNTVPMSLPRKREYQNTMRINSF